MTFKTAKLALVGSTIMAAALASTSAQAATAQADAKARIIEQVTVTKDSDLDFGAIVVGATGGDVTLDSSDGSFNCAAALTCSSTNSFAGFSVVGTAGETVTVDVDATVNLVSGSNSMTATLNKSAATILLDGTDNFTVGGTLTVAGGQANGNYSGTFNVLVKYQ